MDNDPILDAGQIDPEWLAAVLRASGDLREGRVSSVEAVQDTSTHATNARLLVRYSEDAIGSKPSSLFLKLCKPESSRLFGRTEIDLYAKIGAPMADSPVPKCYHYAYAENSGRYHLLLQDLSDTHHHNWDVEPTADSARKTAAGLANMHAWWWDHPQIVEDERYPTAAVIRRYRAQIDRGLAPMLDYLGDRISQETRDILARVFAHHGRRMIERAEEGRHLTYIHGDPNPGNILSPNDPDGKAYVVDRQLFPWSLGVWIGVGDIAYMMVHWWEPAARRRLERTVLETYHATLEQRGVEGYTWDKLWNDYRLAAVQSIYVATAWCIGDDERTSMEWVWWPQLQKSLAAYQDLRCAEIIG